MNDSTHWFTLDFFVFSLALLLYHFHIVNKKTMEHYAELYGFFLTGILVHLLLDVLIIERGPWI